MLTNGIGGYFNSVKNIFLQGGNGVGNKYQFSVIFLFTGI
jgi:hypothetical protein